MYWYCRAFSNGEWKGYCVWGTTQDVVITKVNNFIMDTVGSTPDSVEAEPWNDAQHGEKTDYTILT